MAAWTGGGERSARWAYKAGLAGRATPAGPMLQVHWQPPPGEKAHLGQVRFAMKKGAGCTFTERAGADSSHSAQEVTPRHRTHKTLTCTHIYHHTHTHTQSAKSITASLDFSTSLTDLKKTEQTVKLLFQPWVMRIGRRRKSWHEQRRIRRFSLLLLERHHTSESCLLSRLEKPALIVSAVGSEFDAWQQMSVRGLFSEKLVLSCSD